MAALALRAELAAVHVVPAVTRQARAVELVVRGDVHRLAMAGAAREPAVSAVEREMRLLRMIERPRVPIVRVVAQRAVEPERALVGVVVAVAVDTLPLRVMELRRLVAAVALDIAMLADQGEVAEVVVEAHVLLPCDLAVAGGA